jgi:hypothetical protein
LPLARFSDLRDRRRDLVFSHLTDSYDDGAENFAFATRAPRFFTRNYQRFYHVSLSDTLDSAR